MEELFLFEIDSTQEKPKSKRPARRNPQKKKPIEDLMDSLFKDVDDEQEQIEEQTEEQEEESVSEEEVASAAEAIGLAYFIKDSNRYKLYSFEEEQKIFQEYQKTHSIEIRNQILCSNIKLVIMVAKKIAKVNSKFDIDDMIGEGTLGLIRAIEKFEPERKLKFSTYAYQWIKQNITRAIANTGDTIRLPVHFANMINKINKAEIEYCQENGCESAPDEALMDAVGIPQEKLDKFKTAARVTNSLDSDISSAGEKSHFVSYQDLLVDESMPTPEAAVEEKSWSEDFMKVVEETLSPREVYILRHRYGIGNSEEMTLESLSIELNLTRERIRQIESQALGKLREPLAAFAS